jgi:hypothetical protein
MPTDKKISQDSFILAQQTRAASSPVYFPVVDPSEGAATNRNKRMSLDESSQHYGKFTSLSGSTWDGSNKYRALTGNLSLSFSPGTNKLGELLIKQDGTGSRTLTIEGVSFAINTAANSYSIVSYQYCDAISQFLFFVNPNVATVTSAIDSTAPFLVSATVEAANPSRIILTYNETLDPGSVPATGDFAGIAGGGGYSVTAVSISGATVFVDISATITSGTGTIYIGYTPGTNKIRDAAGNNAASFASQIVTNNVAGGGSVALNAPTSVTLGTATSTTQPMTWADTNSSPNENSYKIQVSPAGAGTWTDAAMTGLSSTGGTATGLTAATSYDYRVIAVGNGTTTTNSAPSSTVTGSTAGSSFDIWTDIPWPQAYNSDLSTYLAGSAAVDGGNVDEWRDTKHPGTLPNTWSFQQADPTHQPVLRSTGINSKKAIEISHDGTNAHYLPTDVHTGVAPTMTFIYVNKLKTMPGSYKILRSSAPDCNSYINGSTGKLAVYGGAGPIDTSYTMVVDEDIIIEEVWKSGGGVDVYVNGVSVGAGIAAGTAPTVLKNIMGSADGSCGHFYRRHLFVLDRELTSGERTDVTNWLKTDAGIA